MKIGIAGPAAPRLVADYLDDLPADAPKGLGGTSVALIARGLLAAGHRVSVYMLDAQVTRPASLSGERLTVFLGPYRPRHRMRDFMAAERGHVRRFIERDAPDVVHAHWTYEYALGALRTGRPTLITVRDWAPAILRFSPDPYRAGRWLMNAATLWKGQHFVANSPYIQTRLQRYLRRPVPVIPNAIDDDFFAGPKNAPASAAPTIVSVNNGFGRRKNVAVLLEAFSQMRAQMPGCQLRLFGSGFGSGGPAEQWAKAHGLQQGVEFLGHAPHGAILAAIRAADLLIHPALEESFGMTLLEAMAVGTPVVAGAESGAVPWVLNDGTAGVLTDVTAPRVVASAALQLLTDPARWRHFSEAGFAHAWESFRLSHIAARYAELYAQLATPSPSRYAPTATPVTS